MLLKTRPVFLFSKGGFVSVPPCISCKLLHIPFFTHECDFSLGLATKINSKFATKVVLSYEQTKEHINKSILSKVIVTGNPVRPIFYNTDKSIAKEFINFNTKEKKPILFVMGGSLGARQINELVYENIEWLTDYFYVIHQTGSNNVSDKIFDDKVLSSYKQYKFIYDELPHVIDYADVILSRAGANSIFECAVLNKPMVLIPLSGNGTRGDQVDNADFFASKGAAIVLKGEYACSKSLVNALESMLDINKRKLFASACKSLLPKTRSAYLIASIIFDDYIKGLL